MSWVRCHSGIYTGNNIYIKIIYINNIDDIDTINGEVQITCGLIDPYSKQYNKYVVTGIRINH